jgi:hypothetical protein
MSLRPDHARVPTAERSGADRDASEQLTAEELAMLLRMGGTLPLGSPRRNPRMADAARVIQAGGGRVLPAYVEKRPARTNRNA